MQKKSMHSKYRLTYKKTAFKYLNRLEPKVFEKIVFLLLKISQWFEEGLDIEIMKGEIDTYRLRLGGLRVVYEKKDTVMTILVLKIWPRWDVYK